MLNEVTRLTKGDFSNVNTVKRRFYRLCTTSAVGKTRIPSRAGKIYIVTGTPKGTKAEIVSILKPNDFVKDLEKVEKALPDFEQAMGEMHFRNQGIIIGRHHAERIEDLTGMSIASGKTDSRIATMIFERLSDEKYITTIQCNKRIDTMPMIRNKIISTARKNNIQLTPKQINRYTQLCQKHGSVNIER